MEEADHYRCRRIYLKPGDDAARQADAACEALVNIDGIVLAAPHSEHSLHIIYSLDQISFEIVTELLDELNFEPDNSLLMSLRNTIFCYLEDNARANMQIDVTDFTETAEDNPEIPQPDDEKYWEDYR